MPRCTDQSVHVLSVLDEFSQECFAHVLDLTPMNRRQWRVQIDAQRFDFFMAEAAWLGNGGMWKHAFSRLHSRSRAELTDALSALKALNVPTVFWNKEDPPNFDLFISAARDFDFVLTTDRDCVPRYTAALGHNRVATLAFAAEPFLHNPIRQGADVQRYCFAGSWMGEKYPQRAARIRDLFALPLARGILDIYDRHAENERRRFPDPYRQAVRGSMRYKDLIRTVYKNYIAHFNINSVETSPTMIARRVYELLACGMPVISSPSHAIEKTFGEVVAVASTARDVEMIMAELELDAIARYRRATRGVRLVHGRHTYANRVEEILTVIGRPTVLRKPDPVTIVCVLSEPAQLQHVAEQVRRQTWPHRRGVFVGLGDEVDLDSAEQGLKPVGFDTFLKAPGGMMLADGLNIALSKTTTRLVAKFDQHDYYGPNYLCDVVYAFVYSRAGVVGKASYFTWLHHERRMFLSFPGRHYRWVTAVQPGTLVWDRYKTGDLAFRNGSSNAEEVFTHDLHRSGILIASADVFNFVHVSLGEAACCDVGADPNEARQNVNCTRPEFAFC